VLPAASGRTAPGGRVPLQVGITEPNPAFVWPAAVHPEPAPFGTWGAELARVRPRYFRLVLDWAALQPRRDAPPDLDAPDPGCMRSIGPCAPWRGVREQLAALAARQRGGGWEGVAVVTGTPAWAAGPPAGCERVGTQPRSRAPVAAALPAYRRLVGAVLAAARAAHADLRWWSAWNEPDRYVTFSPQRARCRAGARAVSPARYAALVGAMRAALDAAPGAHGYLLGDLAGTAARGPGQTTVPEFLGALPRGVVCGASAYAQHAYVGEADPVPDAMRALRARGCGHALPVWITQTGARVGVGAGEAARRAACRALHRRLTGWSRGGAVSAVFQWGFRDDDTFPVGLVSTTLDRAWPALAEWRAWGRAAADGAADAPARAACS
jgi:hypothetical protein